MAQGGFDIDFITINQIAYTFNKLVNSNNHALYRDQLINMAQECLEFMNQYSSLHPSYESLVSYLASQEVDVSSYNGQWAKRLKTEANNCANEVADELTALQIKNVSRKQVSGLYSRVRAGFISRIIQTEYQEAASLLNKYGSLAEFSTQPKTREQYQDNRYVEYLFLKYVANAFSLIWFPLDDNKYTVASGVYVKEGDKLLYSSSSFKPLDKIYNQVTAYQKKNESLFEQHDDEMRYFWIIRFLHLSLLFKQFEFIQFHKEFKDMFITHKEPLAYLISDTSLIKSNLLVMFTMVTIFLKPFNSLSLVNFESDDLIEFYHEDPSKIEHKFYNQVVKPLSEGDTKQVKRVFNNGVFLRELVAYLEYNLPISTSKFSNNTSSFIEYMKVIIDSKLFLTIISNTRAIPRSQVLKHLGYDLTKMSEQELSEVSKHLIGLISALGLGQLGIGYHASEQVFFNHGPPSTKTQLARLQNDIDEVQHELKGDVLSGIMTNLLLEKYHG
ncbi:uncharacterized protein LODBEIA_P35670 [Lodderomyces beijingensis]|uniref:PCI domain-containing protein n=1 Tax=Lodderomyces beijingensis TaxID=1775926 RepID=A0ABP0ZMF4_9ASCO